MSRAVVAHPSTDVYGSDLQVIESLKALSLDGWETRLVVPREGSLGALVPPGVGVDVVPFSPLQKRYLSLGGALRLVPVSIRDLVRLTRFLRRERPDLVYVNTITIPVWLMAARLAGVPVVAHVHEAEEDVHRLVRRALVLPLLLAHAIIANSAAASRVIIREAPRLSGRIEVIYNGVPDQGPSRPGLEDLHRIVFVGRLSPRKGVDTILEAVAVLRSRGKDVTLDVCGSTFPGYEPYEASLRSRASHADLNGAVRFRGYVSPASAAFATGVVVAVPSRAEPFGNVAVEALLAQRAVVASEVQGLAEIIADGRTGVLVPPDDVPAWADALQSLLDDPVVRKRLARAGRDDARQRFSVGRYRRDIARVAGVVAQGEVGAGDG